MPTERPGSSMRGLRELGQGLAGLGGAVLAVIYALSPNRLIDHNPWVSVAVIAVACGVFFFLLGGLGEITERLRSRRQPSTLVIRGGNGGRFHFVEMKVYVPS